MIRAHKAPAAGHNSGDTVAEPAHAELASAFRRWSDIEDRKDSCSEDSKELFAEFKGKSFDTKAMRAVFRDLRKERALEEDADARAKSEEQDAAYEVYRVALDTALSNPRARPAGARVEKIEEFGPKEPSEKVGGFPVAAAPKNAEETGSYGEAAKVAELERRSAGVTAGETAPISKPLRPHCLRPEACGGVGFKHCHQCQKQFDATSKAEDFLPVEAAQ